MPDELKHPARPDEEVLHAGQWLILLRRDHWEYVRRPRSSGACFVVAVTDASELVLVEQYRYPVRGRTIELPAGIIGDGAGFADESATESALRELEEETGFRGSHASLLTSAPTAAGLTSEQSHFVRVTGLQRVADGGGVDGEDIQVHRVPLAGIDAWLGRQLAQGRQVDARIYAALHFLSREAGPRA